MTKKKDYIRPTMKHIELDEMLLAGASLQFGEGTASGEEADAEHFGLFDEDGEESHPARNCWDETL